MSETQTTETPTHTKSTQSLQIKQSSDGKYYLQIPKHHTETANTEIGDKIGIYPINYNGNLAISLSTNNENGVTTKVRKDFGKETMTRVTVPKQLAVGGQLTGQQIRYNSTEGGIIGIIEYEANISGTIDVYDVKEIESMTQWSNGTFPHHIDNELIDKLNIEEKLWFWYDTLGDNFVFALETTEENAPESAIELSIQQRHKDSARAFVFLPRKICKAMEIKGEPMKWGHNGEKILGLVEGN